MVSTLKDLIYRNGMVKLERMFKKISLVGLVFLGFLFLYGCSEVQEQMVSSASFRFVAMGDSQGKYDPVNQIILEKIANQIISLKPKPKFIIFMGDLVSSGNEEQFDVWKESMSIITKEGISIYSAAGNHDLSPDYQIGQNAYKKAFDLPTNGPTGYEELVYYFNYENSLFVCLDSSYYDGTIYCNNEITQAQMNWLQNLLSATSKEHKIVYAHSPAYPVGGAVGSSLDAYPSKRDAFWNILDKNDVDIYFAGHDHGYSRWMIDSSIDYSWESSVYQVITAGAGGTLFDKNPSVNPDVFKKEFHYIVVDINGSNLIVNVYNDIGSAIDNFSVLK